MVYLAVLLAMSAPSETIRDDFAAGLDSQIWDQDLGGASIGLLKPGIRLTGAPGGKAFPYITTKKGFLPHDKRWTLRLDFAYESIGHYGVSVGIRDVVSGRTPFFAHADAALASPKLLTGRGAMEVTRGGRWADYPNSYNFATGSWHTLEVRNENGWTIALDGVDLGTFGVATGEWMVFLGQNERGLANPWDWCVLRVRNFSIEYRDGIPQSAPRVVPKPAVNAVGEKPAVPSTRSRISSLFGVDQGASAPATPNKNGRLRITARRSKVYVKPGELLEFSPMLERPDYTPSYLELYVSGKKVSREPYFGRGKVPVLSYEVPDRDSRLTATVVGIDDTQKSVELLRCDLWARKSAGISSNRLGLKGDSLTFIEPTKAKGVYIFAEDGALGKLSSTSDFRVDARRLPAGQHVFWIIEEDDDGFLRQPSRSVIDIGPRYAIDIPAAAGSFTADSYDSTMPVSIRCLQPDGVAKTRIYVNGTFVREEGGPEFKIEVPMGEVPSGIAIVMAVGVAKDGQLLAPESIALNVRNMVLDSMIARDKRRQDLQVMISKLSEYDQTVVYWYERALSEPEFRTYISGRTYYLVDEFGRMASVGYLDSFTVTGRAGEYFAECKAAIVRRAEYRLRIGRAQKELGLRDLAASTFRQIIAEVGEASGIGLAAKQELERL